MNAKIISIPIIIGIVLIIGITYYPMSEETQIIPEETQIIPEETQIIPEETQIIPEETQIIPEETQIIPEETQIIPEETQIIPEETQIGVMEGVAYYIGKPCPPSQVGPPCDGPYPNYEVVIYERDGKSIVNKITTDDQGNFEVHLPIGDYVVFGKNLDFNKVIEIPIMFTIEPEKTKSIEITINEGIR